MIKIKKSTKIIIVTLSTIFFIVFCIVCVLLGLLRYKPDKLVELLQSGQDTYATIKYYCRFHPSSGDWIEYQRIKSAWKYLNNENVQKIAFRSVGEYDGNSPDNWGWEIIEPEKIKQTLQLISASKRACNISIVWLGRMSIITDKHKFIVPVEVEDDAVYGFDWTSYELRKQLWNWGYGYKVYQYDLPSKEQTVAILLYPISFSPPLALFGDKKLTGKLLFEKDFKDPNGITGLASLYKAGRLLKFGVKSKKEEGKSIPSVTELEPKKILEGRAWLVKIMDAYEIALKEAEEREKYFPMKLDNSVGRIVFMTLDKDYWKEIGIDENAVYDDYIKSERLKAYFDELGLTKELLVGKPHTEKHIAGSKDANTLSTE